MNPRELKSISKEIGVDGDGIRCREAGGAAGRVLVPRPWSWKDDASAREDGKHGVQRGRFPTHPL